jgi:hypothetical protein
MLFAHRTAANHMHLTWASMNPDTSAARESLSEKVFPKSSYLPPPHRQTDRQAGRQAAPSTDKSHLQPLHAPLIGRHSVVFVQQRDNTEAQQLLHDCLHTRERNG